MPDGVVPVDVVRFAPASAKELERGLLGYVVLRVGGLVVDGVTVRRTREGRLALAFPARTDRLGKRHAIVRPWSQAAREDIERQVLARLVELLEPAREA